MNIDPDAIIAAVDATIGDRIINGDRPAAEHYGWSLVEHMPLTMNPPAPMLLGYHET